MIAPSEDKNKPNETRRFLLGAPLNLEKRKEVLASIAADANMQAETTNFLKLLLDTSRMDAIEDIIAVFEEKYNQMTETQARPACSCTAFLRAAFLLAVGAHARMQTLNNHQHVRARRALSSAAAGACRS